MSKIMYNGIAYGSTVDKDYGWTDLIGTLVAGEITLTIQHQLISTDSTIEIYTDTFGINPTNAVVTNGQIVLTFASQSADLGVKIRVSKTNDRIGGLWATEYTEGQFDSIPSMQ